MKLSTPLLVLAFLAGCASSPMLERGPPVEPPVGIVPRTTDAQSEMLLRALSLVGTPYKYGGQSPDTGFDCSGLVQYLFNEVWGVALPRRTQEMSRIGSMVDRDELLPGDLVFFDTLREPYSHVGIYVGNQRFVHAPSTGGRVQVVALNGRYWARRYNGARRIAAAY
jgi:cell wall-associated NlpC family hydrolase